MKDYKVLIDNWSLQQLAKIFHNDGIKFSREYYKTIDNFFLSLTLFDTICYLPNGFDKAWFNSTFGDNIYCFTEPISIEEEDQRVINTHVLFESRKMTNVSEEIVRGSEEYLKISELLSINYFPCVQRSAYIQNRMKELEKNQDIISKFTPDLLVTQLNNTIKNIGDVHNNTLGRNLIDVEMPVILNAIINESNSKDSLIDTAIQMRNDKKTIQTRRWLADMEKLYSEDIEKAIKEYQYVYEVLDEFSKSLGVKLDQDKVNINIGFPLGFGFSKDVSTTSFFKKRRKHLLFIRDVLKKNVKTRINYKRADELFKCKSFE